MGKRLYVGNLSWATTSSDLQQMFEQFGVVRSAEVVMDRVSGRSRGFGFVEVDGDDAMNNSIHALNGKEIDGRPLIVNEARERTERPPGGGGGRGRGPRREGGERFGGGDRD